MADINSRLPTQDQADGATGSAAPSEAILVGGTDGTDLRAISTDSSGNVNINAKDATGSGSMSALNQTVVASTSGKSSCVFDVTGTFSASIIIQATVGDGNWYAIPGENLQNATIAATLAGPALIGVACGGYSQIRLQIYAYTSGTVNVTWYTSLGANVSVFEYVVGNVNSGNADNGGPVKVGGVYNSALPTLSTGQRGDIQLDSSARQIVVLQDGSGGQATTYNGQLDTADIINSSISSGSITVGTSAVALQVGASNLTNRKVLIVCPINGIIYVGATSSVTTSTGIPVFPNNVMTFAVGSGVTPYAIAAASTTVNVMEGA